MITVREAAVRFGVSVHEIYRLLRELTATGQIKIHAGFSGGGKPCRLLDAEGVAILAKALQVGGKS